MIDIDDVPLPVTWGTWDNGTVLSEAPYLIQSLNTSKAGDSRATQIKNIKSFFALNSTTVSGIFRHY